MPSIPRRDVGTFHVRDLSESAFSAIVRRIALSPSSLSNALSKRFQAATLRTRDDTQACQNGFIPGCYHVDGPAPGAVVGIVLGSVLLFILICWLIQSLSGQNNRRDLGEEEIVVQRSPRSRHSRRNSRPEVRHISRSPRRETIIVEDRRRVSPAPRPRSVTRSIIVEEPPRERRVDGDDVVEVIEEESVDGGPPPRRAHRSRRSSYSRHDYDAGGRRYG